MFDGVVIDDTEPLLAQLGDAPPLLRVGVRRGSSAAWLRKFRSRGSSRRGNEDGRYNEAGHRLRER
jgi:hypothetical protein